MSPQIHLVLGGPGCGKTQRLLREAQEALDRGYAPEEVAFVTFTNAAAEEARGRAETDLGLTEGSLIYWRTLHSLSYRGLGLKADEIMQEDHWLELGKLLTEDLTDKEPGAAGALINVVSYSRATGCSLRQAWAAAGGALEWRRVERVAEALRLYKQKRNLVDFDDMLDEYSLTGPSVPVRLAFVDEAQDLSQAQWRVVWKAFSGAERIVIAGDDDQAIYRWAGADVDTFLGLPGSREVLPQSFRLPLPVHALSNGLARGISRRYAKNFLPATHPGTVNPIGRIDELDLRSGGTWLILARTKLLMDEATRLCRLRGIVFSAAGEPSVKAADARAIIAWDTWSKGGRLIGSAARAVLRAMGRDPGRLREDDLVEAKEVAVNASIPWTVALTAIPLPRRIYYERCLYNGVLDGPIQTRVSTVHGAKGWEADNVAVIQSISRRVYEGSQKSPDDEHRVAYVAVTRAKRNLYLVEPRGPLSWQLEKAKVD